jgi:pimeloyl-ACP methyl ester carboxylesterase
VRFTGPGGRRDRLVIGLPAWYGPHDDPPLPLVISPHSRGLTPWQEARRWGELPGRFGIAVANTGLHGRVIPRRSWAWPPDIAEMTDVPRLLPRFLPWLRIDPNRVYAAGDSMGGQETLMLVARRPDLFAAAVAADAVTNFARRWYQFPVSGESWGEQSAATREVGATPGRARWLYVRRSPLFFARTFAFSDVPLQLWWNPKDTVVIREGSTQTGDFYRTVKRLNPRAPIVARLDHTMHGWSFKYDHQLPEMVRFLLAHRRHGPPAGFAYASWEPRATIWRWRVHALDPDHGLWSIRDVTPRGLVADSPAGLVIEPPGGRAMAVPSGLHAIDFASRLLRLQRSPAGKGSAADVDAQAPAAGRAASPAGSRRGSTGSRPRA